MRLTSQQVSIIISTTQALAGEACRIWLYGSRLDDTRQGGDIDLLVETIPRLGLLQRAQIKNQLEKALQLPVDVLVTSPDALGSPFVTLAKAQAISLNDDTQEKLKYDH